MKILLGDADNLLPDQLREGAEHHLHIPRPQPDNAGGAQMLKRGDVHQLIVNQGETEPGDAGFDSLDVVFAAQRLENQRRPVRDIAGEFVDG
ncbi:hypothetical protein D3C75_987140 [compost metagenome]